MSEDVSATMRVGITVILVAALVATVLNLMVMSNSLLNGGQTTLQSGIDSVSQQEFAAYDNTKVSGTQVNTALSLFQGRDVAIIIQTKAFASSAPDNKADKGDKEHGYAFNYGALLTADGAASNGKSNMPTEFTGTVNGDNVTASPNSNGASQFITAQSNSVYLVAYSESSSSSSKVALYRPAGASNYKGVLHNTNGVVDANYNIIGTTELGNSQYLLSSARFQSVLIKDDTGAIMGIFFKQLN